MSTNTNTNIRKTTKSDLFYKVTQMFLDIMERTGADASLVHAVGDSLRDLQAADAAGCQVHLVKTGNGQALLDKLPIDGFPSRTLIHKDLSEFADYVLQLPVFD